jgi:hypothetical protein
VSPHRKIAASLAVLAIVLTFLLAVAFGQRSIRRWIALVKSPVGAAQWIWAPRVGEHEGPLAFYVVKDFEIGSVPAGSRLLCLADESYLAYLNGQLVGSGRYRTGAPLDAYDVTSLLEPGLNRLTFELRSGRGVGALLASLELGPAAGRREVVTGDDWRVFWRFRSEIFGLEPLEGGAGVRTWGPPPSGRWRTPPSVRELPLRSELVGQAMAVEPVNAWAWNGERWHRVRPRRRGMAPVPSGPMVMFEWDPPRVGYLYVHQRTSRAKPALLFAGLERPVPDEEHPDGHILPVPGRSGWTESLPRAIRYALVVGASAPVSTALQPVDSALATPLLAPRGTLGVFGLDPPLLRTPVEDEVWRQVEGVARAAGREER